MPRLVVLAFASEAQQALLCAALAALDIPATGLPLSAHLETAIAQAMRGTQPPLLLIDIVALAQLGTDAEEFGLWKRKHCAGADLLLYCSNLRSVNAQARAWAQSLGAHDLMPGFALAHAGESLRPAVARLLSVPGMGTPDETGLKNALQKLPVMHDDTAPLDQAWRHHQALCQRGIDPHRLIAKMCGNDGVDIRARRFRAKTYAECFVGGAAVDWLAQSDATRTRTEALHIGQALLELGYINHVTHEQPFQDGHFFYRMRADTPRLNAIDLCAVTSGLRNGAVAIRDRKFHGVRYRACFVGAEAVTWMREQFQLSENEAVTLGQRLMDLFIVHHVVDRQPFRAGRFFYRFFSAASRSASSG